jgi:ABC-type Zn uptake system ZnuABC Zn-binding protein ZnuA
MPLLGFVLAAAAGCEGRDRPAGGELPAAVATIAPLADFARSVAGPGWTVRTVIPPGTSPHVFEPEPSDLRKLAGAKVVVVAGAGYDDWMRKALAACASEARVHDAARTLGIGPGREEHEEERGASEEGPHVDHEGHAHGVLGEDPHWWLSPVLASESLAPLAESFASVDPIHADGYRRRAREYAVELLALDRELALVLAPLRGKRFVSAHRAWVYFAERYGLVEAASIEPIPGREPSPRELKALVEEGRRGGLGRLFTEPQFPPAAARVVAREARLALTLVDPIGGFPGRETYPALMRFNAAAFRQGLLGAKGAPE